MPTTTNNTVDRELAKAELDHVVGGLTCRKAGEGQQDFIAGPATTNSNSVRGRGGQFGP